MKTLEIKNISKRFGDHVVLNDLNARFEEGTITAITGASGCGKSTLLNIIGLLEKPTSGQVIFEGYGEGKISGNKTIKLLRYEIAYLFQNYALIDNESVESNLKIALEYTKQKKDRNILVNALKQVHLDEDMLKKKIFTLSGGEQQRVAMARVILKPCSVVLADEPTGNLDESNKMEIFKLLKQMADQGKIVIMVTHDQFLSEQCDQRIDLVKA
ncbi:putative bacteriocin export ABC transporter [Clostridiaceae bacterium DONG20-135]|uniref:Putative bacteriocin export ABC transporter n=1 Tax=Copranaerobaculum intestinale TaxID=2692629 RepID=A0A6N8U813_9FIRM|nr:putative bacteriocin export ABC transporter [Copranaerobaculum intestinale]MXQ73675.1 putative bacteriocin export ABC transporter [Copranaerobaculum intestinale]